MITSNPASSGTSESRAEAEIFGVSCAGKPSHAPEIRGCREGSEALCRLYAPSSISLASVPENACAHAYPHRVRWVATMPLMSASSSTMSTWGRDMGSLPMGLGRDALCTI